MFSLAESVCEEGPGICSHLLTLISLLIILVTLPFSLCCVVQVVQVTRHCKDKNKYIDFLCKLSFDNRCMWCCRSVDTAEDSSFVSCSSCKRWANVKMINGYKYVSPSYFYKCFRKVFVSIILNIWSKPAKSILCYEETILSYCYWSNLSISIEKVKFYDKFQSHKSKWLELEFWMAFWFWRSENVPGPQGFHSSTDLEFVKLKLCHFFIFIWILNIYWQKSTLKRILKWN